MSRYTLDEQHCDCQIECDCQNPMVMQGNNLKVYYHNCMSPTNQRVVAAHDKHGQFTIAHKQNEWVGDSQIFTIAQRRNSGIVTNEYDV